MSQTPRTLVVWDPLVRIFHWSLVLAFATAYATGDELEPVHEGAGYVILGLLAFRLVWGFAGPRHARFTDFVRGPAAVSAYLRSLASGRPIHYLGHNPAGGWMVLALLLTLGVTCWSGLEALASEGRGPLAAAVPTLVATARANGRERESRERREDSGDGEFWEDVHEAAANLCLALVVLHVAGVIVSSVLHRENLVRAMVTGRKQAPPG